MNNRREKSIMDFNQSLQFSSTSKRPLQMHDFMPMPASTLHDVRGQHTLPLARIKKVMKSDEQVKMISADTPVVFAKACEMFIMELSLRAWMHTQDNKRRTLQRNDVANAIRDEDLLVFLKDIVPMEIHQGAPPPLSAANHHGVYVPLPHRGPSTHPIFPVNLQSINQIEAAQEGRRAVATDPRLAFPMNLNYNINPAYFTRDQEIQQGPVFPPPPPPPPANGANPYLGFKV
ncbi:hypothetical protein Pfo_008459 [Paulownia fortunei]|nr:hypothetical protein Pfo_008459 [Paulownia fortunei]